MPLVLGCLEALEGVLKLAVHEVGVDQRCGEIAVIESPLDHQDVPGSAVEVRGEGVPERLRAQLLVDTCSCKPVLQPSGYLALTEPLTTVGEE